MSLLLGSLEKTNSDLEKELEKLESLKSAETLDLFTINETVKRIEGFKKGKENLKALLTELFPNWQKEIVERYSSI